MNGALRTKQTAIGEGFTFVVAKVGVKIQHSDIFHFRWLAQDDSDKNHVRSCQMTRSGANIVTLIFGQPTKHSRVTEFFSISELF